MAHLFPRPNHNHNHCKTDIMEQAHKVCHDHGARLTKQRRLVLEVLADSHKAMGAYDIIDALRNHGLKLAPMSVYRQLDFLRSLGLAHRIASMNAFVACTPRDKQTDSTQFLICDACGQVAQIHSHSILDAIMSRAASAAFAIRQPTVEISGICCHCEEQHP